MLRAVVCSCLVLIASNVRAQTNSVAIDGALPPSVVVASPGAVVGLTISGGGNNPAQWDWIALYPAGAAGNGYIDWWWLDGTKTAPSAPVSNPAFTITLPSTPGAYELRFLSYYWQLYATSSEIQVGASAAVQITGTGTVSRIPKFLNSTGTIGNSALTEISGKVGIGTITPLAVLDVQAQNSVGGTAGLLVKNGGYAQSLPNSDVRAAVAGVGLYTNTAGVRSPGVYGWVPTGGHGPFASAALFDRLDLNKRIFIGGHQNVDYPASLLVYDTSTSSTDFIVSGYDGGVGIGTAAPQSRFHVVGNSLFAGDITVTGNIGAKYQDVAEWVDASEPLEPGTVVIIDDGATNRVVASSEPYDLRVAGAVSPRPGILLGEESPGRERIAQSGRVRIKVDAQYGSIRAGDLLVTSPRKGYAMRSRPVRAGDVLIHRPGTVLGKALEPLPKGSGEILVLLTLQ